MNIQPKIKQVWEARSGDKFIIVNVFNFDSNHCQITAAKYNSYENSFGNNEFIMNYQIVDGICICHLSAYDLLKIIIDVE